jgi:hypothetical protein
MPATMAVADDMAELVNNRGKQQSDLSPFWTPNLDRPLAGLSTLVDNPATSQFLLTLYQTDPLDLTV